MQIGIHQIDNLLYLLGEAEELTAYVDRLETEPDIEDVTSVLMRFKSGAIGFVASDYISPRRFMVNVHGTKGNAFFDMDNDGLRIQLTEEAKSSPVSFPPADHLLAELEDFADAARDGRKPEIDGTDALNPLAVVLGAIQSSREGRSIRLAEILGEA